jgi:zinc transport system substrate-binding protein
MMIKALGTKGMVAALVLCLLHGIGDAAERLPVFVSIVPQRYFVEKIGGERVRVSVMVRPGASPATYEPKPRQMVDLSEAAVYFAVGVPFERVWLDKMAAANSNLRIVRTDAGIEKLPMSAHVHAGAHVHDSGTGHGSPAAETARGILDPHIWLSPSLVKIQAHHIRDGLIAADPAHRRFYENNTDAFIRELNRLHGQLQRRFDSKAQRRFMVFHPAWGYFAKAYGLIQVPIEIEGKSPKAAELKTLIAVARQRDIRAIFVQPQFSTKSAELIAREIGAEVVIADPLAPDWAANLERVAVAVAAALR